VTLTVVGEVDTLSAPILLRAEETAWTDGPRRVVIDLRAVTFLDANALRALLHARQTADARAATLVLVTPPGHVARLLEWVGLHGCSADLRPCTSGPGPSPAERRASAWRASREAWGARAAEMTAAARPRRGHRTGSARLLSPPTRPG
jgi:anti-anti-sigma factor